MWKVIAGKIKDEDGNEPTTIQILEALNNVIVLKAECRVHEAGVEILEYDLKIAESRLQALRIERDKLISDNHWRQSQ